MSKRRILICMLVLSMVLSLAPVTSFAEHQLETGTYTKSNEQIKLSSAPKYVNLIRFEKNDKVGYKNKAGKVIIPAIYHKSSSEFTSGIALIGKYEKGKSFKHYALFNSKGKRITGWIFGYRGKKVYFTHGLILLLKYYSSYNSPNQVAVVNMQGKIIVPFSAGYNELESYMANGYVKAYAGRGKAGGKFGILNKKGKLVVPVKYNLTYYFGGDTYVGSSTTSSTVDIWNLKTGKKIKSIPCGEATGLDSEGRFIVYDAKKWSYFRLYNLKGKLVTDLVKNFKKYKKSMPDDIVSTQQVCPENNLMRIRLIKPTSNGMGRIVQEDMVDLLTGESVFNYDAGKKSQYNNGSGFDINYIRAYGNGLIQMSTTDMYGKTNPLEYFDRKGNRVLTSNIQLVNNVVYLKKLPTKTDYVVGEGFDATGFQGIYNDYNEKRPFGPTEAFFKANSRLKGTGTPLYDGYKFTQPGLKTIYVAYNNLGIVECDKSFEAASRYFMFTIAVNKPGSNTYTTNYVATEDSTYGGTPYREQPGTEIVGTIPTGAKVRLLYNIEQWSYVVYGNKVVCVWGDKLKADK